MDDWGFIKQLFFTDEGYMERNMEELVKQKKEVEELSIELADMMSEEWGKILKSKIENPKKKLWEFMVCSINYQRLQMLHTQISDNGIIVFGDYYFEKVFLMENKQLSGKLDRGKYSINTSLPLESTQINLADLDREIYQQKKPYRKQNFYENNISSLEVARKFIENELGIVYDCKMARKERFEYLKLLNLLYKNSANLQYLRCPSANRIQNDLISTSSPYHKIIFPIIREVIKEIPLDKLNQLSTIFLLFELLEVELEKYTIYELTCILDVAFRTTIMYAAELLSQRRKKLIKKLKKYRGDLETAEGNWPIFQRFYIRIYLWVIENKFHLTDGYQNNNSNLAKTKSLVRLKQKVSKKIPIENLGEFINVNKKEITQLVLVNDDVTKNDINNIKRPESVEKYKILLQMNLALRKESLNAPVLLEEVIAVIQVVKRYKDGKFKILDPAYKGGEKIKSKSLKSIVTALIQQRKDQSEFLKMADNKYLWILHDMIADQLMWNLGVPITVKQKMVVRMAVYKTYLKEVNNIDSVPSEGQANFIEDKAEKLKNKIFEFIWV